MLESKASSEINWKYPISIDEKDLFVARDLVVPGIHPFAGRCTKYNSYECIGVIRQIDDKGKPYQIRLDIKRIALNAHAASSKSSLMNNMANTACDSARRNLEGTHRMPYDGKCARMNIPFNTIPIGRANNLHEAFQLILQKTPLIKSNMQGDNPGPDIQRFWDSVPMATKKKELRRLFERNTFSWNPVSTRNTSYKKMIQEFQQKKATFSENPIQTHIMKSWILNLENLDLGTAYTPRSPREKSYAPIPPME